MSTTFQCPAQFAEGLKTLLSLHRTTFIRKNELNKDMKNPKKMKWKPNL